MNMYIFYTSNTCSCSHAKSTPLSMTSFKPRLLQDKRYYPKMVLKEQLLNHARISKEFFNNPLLKLVAQKRCGVCITGFQTNICLR